MIISEIRHGLGNQLFQYAFASWVARETGHPLYLDTHWYRKNKKRSFQLNSYTISAHLLTSREQLLAHCRLQMANILGRSAFLGLHLIDEGDWNENLLGSRCCEQVFLRGFWQNTSWSETLRTQLLSEFTLKHPLSSVASQWAQRLEAEPAIGVHVRRGDYLAARHLDRYPQLTSAYYRNALAMLSAETTTWPLYVFTDDARWATTHLDLDRKFSLVSGEDSLSDVEEFELLRRAAAYVMAPSSFSWWAAWLSMAPNPEVIMPSPWDFKNPDATSALKLSDWKCCSVPSQDV